MDANTLSKRVDAAIRRVGGMDRQFVLRTQTNSTGDELIGRETSTPVDTVVSPQPVYRQLGKRDLIYLTSNGRQVTADDYKITFSPLSVTLDQLKDPTLEFVLKSGLTEEVLKIIYVDPESYQGATVVITAIARSVSDNG